MGADIASANYQQEPIDLKGRLYQKFSTYETRSNYIKIWNYTDTADTGADNLCSIVFGETEDHKAEVLDVLFTKEPMEKRKQHTLNKLK